MGAVAPTTNKLATPTRYRQDGLGIESRWGEIFRTRSDRPWDTSSLLYNRYRVSFAGLKRPERGVDHPPSSRAEIKEGIELYSPSGPSWPVLERTLPFIFHLLLRNSVGSRPAMSKRAALLQLQCGPRYNFRTTNVRNTTTIFIIHIYTRM